ncbi:MAG: hypothetical protein RI952_40 [Bacteroidota bacterium]|jgi:hypothetical protein
MKKLLRFFFIAFVFLTVNLITSNSAKAQYCTAPHTSASPCISNVVFSTISNSSGTTCAVPSYTNYPTTTFTATLIKGLSYNMSVVSTGTSDNKVSVWIDFNHDFVYDASEWTQVYAVGQTGNINITIPTNAVSGQTGMRIRSRLASSPNGATDPCTSFGGGETEDYTVTIMDNVACTTPPVAGTTVASSTYICPTVNFNLSLTGNTFGTGLTYQWQVSADSLSWTDITGATNVSATSALGSVPSYYRCKSTCSSVSSYSVPVKVRPRPQLAAGTYTMNPTLSPSATNFTSFADFISSVNCGVTGPVVLNVKKGTYVGSLSFLNVSGTSAVNTITINGANSKLIDTLTSTKPDYILQIRNSNYITIDSMTFEAHANSTKGYVVSMGDCNYNTIKNCKIIGDQTGTGTTFGGIVISGSTSSYSTATTARYNKILNNDISGGYFGIAAYGSTTIANMFGNQIKNNIIRDYYTYGTYLYGHDSLQFVSNNFHRLNRLITSSGYGVYVAGGGQQLLIKGNRIHDLFNTPTGTSAFYGIYLSSTDGTVAKPNLIINNALYNLNTGGSQYCIYNIGSDYCYYYNNTLYIDNPSATAGLVYGFYQSTLATGIELKNNIFSISKGGSGAKYALYFGTATTIPISNYNNLYVNTAVVGTGVNNIAYHSAAQATLATWKAYMSSAYDQNSVSVDPIIANAATGNLKPNAVALNNAGTSLTAVTDDITGAVRSSTPDIGAYEFSPANDDAMITALVSPKGVCPGLATVSVRVKNIGLTTLNSVQLNWSLNNILQTPLTFTSPILSNSDTVITVGTFNVTANTIYNLKVYTSLPNNGTDANPLNDTVILNNFRSGLTGTYTVGATGADFTSITAVADILSANGVCGPVVINVNPASGPYAGFTLQNITGLSAINTLKVNGNGAVINTTTNGINLYKVNYTTIDSFVINVNGTAGFGINLREGDYNTIKRNKVNITQDKITSTFAAFAMSGSASSATTAGRFRYNTIENNVFTGGYYLFTIYGSSTDLTSAVGNVVRNNKLIDGYVYSAYLLGTDSLIFENNEIARPTRTLNISTFYGTYIGAGARNVSYRNNKIHSPFPTGYTGTATSYILYSAADATVGNENIFANNAVYNIGGSGTVYAIYNPGADGSWYFNNTIDIAGSGAGTVYGVYQSSAATNLQFKNNTININRVSGTGTRVIMYFAATTSTIISNYNHFNGNSGVTYGQYGTTTYANLAAWKTANSATYDQNSVDGDPLFNLTKLVIPKTGSPLLAAGTPIPQVSTDIKGIARSGSNPSIGAYEQGGDFSGPTIKFAPILNTASTSNYTLNAFATITDSMGVDTAFLKRPRLYYKKSTDSNTYAGNTAAANGWKYVIATNKTSPYNFVIDYSLLRSAVAVNNEIQYFVVAQDNTAAVSTNAEVQFSLDATSVALTSNNFPIIGTPNKYRIGTGVSGTLLVGTGKAFASLTKAGGVFEYLNNNLLGGNVNIVVTSNLTEDGTNALNYYAETAGSGYNITIKSNGDTLRTIAGAYIGGLIRINGADRVKIDGSYNGTGSYLTFDNNTTSSGNATIQLISLGNNAGVENFTLNNCKIIGGTGANTIPIHIGGLSLPYSAGESNKNIKITNNTIIRGSVGLYVGGATATPSDSVIITGNTIGSDVVADQLRLYGIVLDQTKNSAISSNTIKNIINTASQQAWGIAIYSGFKNGIIKNNKIEKVASGSGAFGGRGIEIRTNKQNENISIINNFVGNMTGGGSPNLNSTANVGISIRNTTGLKLYYNSVSLSGNIAQTTGSTPDISAALHLGLGAGSLDIRNNSFNNSLANTSDTSYAYALYSEVTDTAFTNFNYNNFYVSGLQGKLGFLSTDLLTLADLKSLTNANNNSLNNTPNHISAINLHAQGTGLYQKGTNIVGITTDIDGDARNISTPCIGADEFLPPAKELKVLSILYPTATALCGNATDSIVIAVQNLGTATQTSFTMGAQIKGAINTSVSNTFTGSILPNQIDTITIKSYNSAAATGAATIKAYINLSGDIDATNDSVSMNTVIYAVPAAPTVTVLKASCAGGSAILKATSTASILWFNTPNGGTAIGNKDSLITPAITAPTTFYAEATTSTMVKSSLGPLNTSIGAGALTNLYTYQVLFTVNNTVKIDSIAVFPSASGVVGIRIRDGANTTTLYTFNFTITAVSGAKVFLPLNLTLPAGNYRIDANTGTTNVNLYRNTAGSSYPYANPGNNIVLTGHTFTGYPQYHYYFYDWKVSVGQSGCPSSRVPVTVTPVALPAGSGFAKAAPYQGVYNAGTISNFDAACILDTMTYSFIPPTGFNAADFGTTWTVNNVTVKTLTGANPVGAVNVSGLNVRYIASSSDIDSTLIFTASVKNNSTGCDTIIRRYLKVFASPTVNLGADITICEGSNYLLDAGNAGATYLWSTGATTQTIRVNTAGTYMVTVTNAAGCDHTDAIVITTNPQPILNLGANINSCVGNTITLDAGNVGATYLWSNGSVSQTIQVTQSGNYNVAVTNALGCVTRDTIAVNFNTTPVVNLGIDRAICTNDAITLDAGNAGATYLWSTGATTQTIVVSAAATYSVTVTNSNGCSTTDAIIITHKATPSALITTSAVNLLNVQFNAVVAPGQTYNWSFGDPTSPSNVSSLANPVHTFSAAGQYFVTLTVANVATGCSATNTDTVTVQAVGVNNINANLFKLQAAPNPFSGSTKLAFNLPIAAQVSMEVFDLLGRNIATIIEKENLTAGAHTVSYLNEDHSNAAGIYLVKLTVNGTTAIIRINDIATK